MRTLPIVLSLPLLAAIGCAVDAPITPTAHTDVAAGFKGKMFGGQQPIVGATVSVVAMSTSGYGDPGTVLGTPVTTDVNGGFTYGTYTCPANNPQVYILGQGGDAGSGANSAIMLVSGIGNCSTAPSVYANINEVTTAATAFALSHFFTTNLGVGSPDSFAGTATAAEGNNAGLVMANTYTIPLLVSIPYGTANTSTATTTLETAKLNSIANTLAACVNSNPSTSNTCATLFTNTTPPGGRTAPSDTLQAAVQMALYPYQNVTTLYNLAPPASPFIGLGSAPADFSLAVSYSTPAMGLSIAGTATTGSSSTIDIDATGRVWFPTNTTTAHGIAYFDPTTISFNGPYETNLVSPQYVAIDTEDSPIVFANDMSSGQIGAVAINAPASPTGSFVYAAPGVSSTGPLAVSNNATTNNAVLFAGAASGGGYNLYKVGGGSNTVVLEAPFTLMPTGLAAYTRSSPDAYFEAEVASSGSSTACLLEGSYNDGTPADTTDQILATSGTPCISGGAAQMTQGTNESLAMATTQNQICSYNRGSCFAAPVILNAPQGVALDGNLNVWVANAGGNSVSTFLFSGNSTYTTTATIPYAHTTTMPMPYGLAIDRSGNVWVSNAGCVNNSTAACTPGSFVLSELIGAAAPTLTPLAAQSGTTPTGGTKPLAIPVAYKQATTRNGRLLNK